MAERKKREWKDFNPNRGTSKTNNPLIKKDDWLSSKIKQREGASSSSEDRSKYVAPNNKEYAGPGGGPDQKVEAAKQQVKPKPPQPRESKPRQRPGAGREDMMSRYMEERKRKQSGQSRVIGS